MKSGLHHLVNIPTIRMKQIRLGKEKSKTNCSSEAPFDPSPRFRKQMFSNTLKSLYWNEKIHWTLYQNSKAVSLTTTRFRVCVYSMGLPPKWLSGKECTCSARDGGGMCSVPRLGQSPGGGHGNPV